MEAKKNQTEYFQVRAHVANRISSFRGNGNVEESTVEQMGEDQGSQLGDLFQAGHHGNMGVSGAVRNKDNMLEGESDQGGSGMREQVIGGDRKNSDSDLNSLHVPETSVREHLPHVASTISVSHIIYVRPAPSS